MLVHSYPCTAAAPGIPLALVLLILTAGFEKLLVLENGRYILCRSECSLYTMQCIISRHRETQTASLCPC